MTLFLREERYVKYELSSRDSIQKSFESLYSESPGNFFHAGSPRMCESVENVRMSL